jgi:hypothetical protein
MFGFDCNGDDQGSDWCVGWERLVVRDCDAQIMSVVGKIVLPVLSVPWLVLVGTQCLSLFGWKSDRQ